MVLDDQSALEFVNNLDQNDLKGRMPGSLSESSLQLRERAAWQMPNLRIWKLKNTNNKNDGVNSDPNLQVY